MTEKNEEKEAEGAVKEELEKQTEKEAEKEEKEELENPPEETQKAEDLISKANTAAARQEEANVELKGQLDRQERMNVEAKLGGKSAAGSKTQTKEEKEIESTKKFLEGTGFAEDLFPEK